ncbi:CinA family protein [Nocardia farcinica]|uniref:CinA family protein n=1 Tax=Nocardia farcinica TaxID=37329 RepID=UPI0024548DE9|nr:CinA family protein [Nocardia farcinica]
MDENRRREYRVTDESQRAEELAEVALRQGITIAVAESLTSGKLSAALGAAGDSAEWFRGGIVSYSAQVKHRLLDVPDVPVVSATAAAAMAAGARRLLEADVAVAVTGVGGPDPQDGEPAGSVWFGVVSGDGELTRHHVFDGEPVEVLEQTVDRAVELLLEVVRGDAAK